MADAGGEALFLFHADGRMRRRLALPPGVVTPTALAHSPDGGRVAVAARDGSITLLDLGGDGGGATRRVMGRDLRAVPFEPGGRIFTTSFGDGPLVGVATGRAG